MTAEERQQLNSLCLRIQDEKDPDRFSQLVQQLNDLLQRKEHRLVQTQPKPPQSENSK
jgi:hypothetical protein